MSPTSVLESPCSLYCGVCRMYQATQSGDITTLGRLARLYSRLAPALGEIQAEDLLCDGCLSTRRAITCRLCAIRQCTQDRQLAGCHACPDFPCSQIDQFPNDVGRRVIMRSVPDRRTSGTASWVANEIERYRCPTCQHELFRGVRMCSNCRNEVDLD